MLRRRPDQDLRRLVVELATTTPDDIAAVLAGLEAAQRERVEALLANFSGAVETAASAPPAAAAPEPLRVEGFSPWLAARLRYGAQPQPGASATARPRRKARAGARGQGMAFTMTQAALEALRSSATLLQAQGQPELQPRGRLGQRLILRLRETLMTPRLAS